MEEEPNEAVVEWSGEGSRFTRREFPADTPSNSTSVRLSVLPDSSLELIEKAINRGVRKYCRVSGTIASGEGGTRVDHTVRIVNAG